MHPRRTKRKTMRSLPLFFLSLVFYHLESLVVALSDDNGEEFLIGTGIYDMTGPAAQINMMGYARGTQNAHGIHQRLRARAYLISEAPSSSMSAFEGEILRREAHQQVSRLRMTKPSDERKRQERDTLRDDNSTALLASQADPETTVCFVSIDAGMGSDLLNLRVLKRLNELLPAQVTSGKRLCHLENLSISGTHTHSAPGGFLQYALYQFTSLGFSEEVMQAYTEGVAQAILQAYETMQKGSIGVAEGLLFDANINRSPSSYLLNPSQERDLYADQGDTDKNMMQLSFTASNGQSLGLLNWFAVHGTSMNSSNLLISGDNKGYASYLMEKHVNGNSTFPGQGPFVAAFASTNLGDVSPNTAGPRCIDTGLPCDLSTSTCNGKATNCIASGPGKDMFESTEIIGRRQFEHSLKLASNVSDMLQGKVDYRHSFVDMSRLNVTLESGEIVQTCPAALGYSFAGGTTDGPGDFDFTQGSNTSNPFWNVIGGFLSIPSKEQIECQHPKPILLNTGRIRLPYDWDPNRVPISIFRVGSLFILNVPSEFTTMAGRRLRRAVRQVLVDGGIEDPFVTIAGLANSYTHYVTTLEEYAGQRYEAASTLYGPYTLSAYIQEFERITTDLVQGQPSESGDGPRDLSARQLSLIPPIGVDFVGLGSKFGSVAVDPRDEYARGETVAVSFRSANPRNDPRIERTFLTVDKLNEDGSWTTLYVDGDWCTQFHWKGGLERWETSFAEIHWKVPYDVDQGLYRLCHYGTAKTFLGNIEFILYSSPDWLKTNLIGSYAVSMLLQSVELAIELSERLQRFFSTLEASSRLKSFEGCSRTFLIRNA